MEEEGITLDSVEPSWMDDGGGIIGDQPDAIEEDIQDWDTNAWSDDNQSPEDFAPAGGDVGCLSQAGDPPGSGTWILGSVDGTCQWIDTTTCS